MKNIKPKFKIIRGGKTNPKISQTFYSAIATRTRLMGVIALKVHWITTENKNFVQWFLLDAEEHGIYDYASILTFNENELDLYTDRFMGSLGGGKVSISEEDVIYLIKNYGRLNLKFNQPLPPPSFEYDFIIKRKNQLDIQGQEALTAKIYEKIESPIQLVNFFLMKVVANDLPGSRYLYCGEDLNIKLVDKASILLKNTVKLVEEHCDRALYTAKSIIDSDSGYINVVTLVETKKAEDEFRVKSVKVVDKFQVPYELIYKEIKKQEHILVYRIGSCEALERELLIIKPKLLKYEFINGLMFVEYRKNNDHVKNEEYYLGADLLAIYFISDFDEFIICYYDENDMNELQNLLNYIKSKGMLSKPKEIVVEGSVIYQYAQNLEEDFMTFINNIVVTNEIDTDV
ncbi:hypothetical protein [Serpentinicella alkaliphila]|uniref:Uncharacterized protein n=1 Tax=Serpentinicella alkaliphila TaxID=1734049 RepID=A0A4R2U2D8_9FIRM|nr:hypothetical protein [Serpentinicella alkaliphila]QUH26745.1 hypothetical protein HZR23_14130 [Serpentinicella alkaliphila]TCQ07965.1 hypothetical protein EDD79_100148 [Serpentinicella alkaliphila]